MSGVSIVITKLLADADVTAVTTKGGIYPEVVPQNGRIPCVITRLVGGADGLHLSGQNDYFVHRVSVECVASTATAASELGDKAYEALKNTMHESVGGFSEATIVFADTDMFDYSDDRTSFRRVMHFRVRWRR